MPSLNSREFERYHRQIMVGGIGLAGQERLKEATVLVAGVGGLGCTSALYLAAAGVGRIILVDNDRVDITNLNRQVLHWEDNLGDLKTDSAGAKLAKFNSDIDIQAVDLEITSNNVSSMLNDVDLVVDGLDNYATRAIINQACVNRSVPFIHAAIYGLSGQLMTIMPGQGPCYQCVRPTGPPEDAGAFPVLGATPGIMACLQSMEAIKIMAGLGTSLAGKLLLFDDMSFHTIEVQRQEDCPTCGGRSE